MHVSTAFNNLDQPEMKEEVQPSKVDPVKLMELLDCLDNETLQKVAGQYVAFTTQRRMWRVDRVILIVPRMQISWPLPQHLHLYKSAS